MIGIKKLLTAILVLAMLTTVFLVGMPGVRADENYDHTYTDPSGDVYILPSMVGVSGHEEIDTIEISSLRSGDNIILKMKVVGTIVDNGSGSGIIYGFSLDANSDGESDYLVDYRNKCCELHSEETGLVEDISSAASGSGTNTLTIVVPLSLLNNPSALDILESWANDVRGDVYYRDRYTGETTGDGENGGGEDGTDGEDGAVDGEETEEKEDKGFIPGFETAFLLAAVGVSVVLLRRKQYIGGRRT